MEYTDIRTIENYLLIEIDLSFQDQVEEWIRAMSDYINNKTGRIFIADSDMSIRKYDGDGTNILLIDDCIDIEKVEVNGVDVDFLVYPSNRTPYKKVILENEIFTSGYQNIEVKAKWGYSINVPEDIKFVTTVLVSGIIQHSLSHEGEIQSMSMGRYSVSYKTEQQLRDFEQAIEILKRYQRYDEVR